MTHLAGFHHAQLILFLEAVDDCVEATIRFCSSPLLVGSILRVTASRGYEARATGRPG
jgi:hypothetical protein